MPTAYTFLAVCFEHGKGRNFKSMECQELKTSSDTGNSTVEYYEDKEHLKTMSSLYRQKPKNSRNDLV